MKPFVPNSSPTLGVEQEFHLIDAQTGHLTPAIDRVLAVLDDDLKESIDYELFQAVLEYKTPVCQTADELLDSVIQSRARLARACEEVGVRLAAAGTHPFTPWQNQPAVDNDHYRWVMDQCGYLARRMFGFGLHIHVGMASLEAAMYALNEMRQWVYPLLALSANSPYFEGHLTGLASVRAHLFGSMPRTGMVPHFSTFAELEDFYNQLVAAGDITRPGDLWWVIRPQPPLGTIEVRACDLPTDARRLAAFAALVQAALAVFQDQYHRRQPPTPLRDHYLDENRWKAMRFGLNCDIIHPQTGQTLPIRDYLQTLLALCYPKARQLHSAAHLDYLETILRTGDSESSWQIQTCQSFAGNLQKLEFAIADRTIVPG